MSGTDPFLLLTLAQESADPEVKLFPDEVKELGLAVALLVRQYAEVTDMQLEDMQDIPRFNTFLVRMTNSYIDKEMLVLTAEEYNFLLFNIDAMLFRIADGRA